METESESGCNEETRSLEELLVVIYSGKNWHFLSPTEKAIAKKLEESGHLRITAGMFVIEPAKKR